MSARTKIQKSLGVGAYAPVVFQPSATGENIKRAVGEMHLTGVTICGITVNRESPGTPWTGLQGRQDVPPCAPALPLSESDAQLLDAQKAIDWRARGAELAKAQVQS